MPYQICKHCKHPIQLIRYARGPKWMHVRLGASFPSELKGTVWEFCKIQAAEPEEVSDADVSSERSLS